MRYVSIKLRVTLWFTFLMAVIVTLVLVFMLVVSRVGVSHDAEYALLKVLDDNSDEFDFDHGILDLDSFDFTKHDVFVSLYNEDGGLVAGYDRFEFEGGDEFRSGVTRQVICEGRDYLARDEYVTTTNGNYWLRGLTLTTNNYSSVRTITIISVILFPVLLVIAAAGGWLIASQAFKPVKRITDTVEAITDGSDLTKRIGLKKGRDEIHRLAATFDRLLDRLESSFEAEKRFASDASHELRTPTAVIIAESDYALENAESAEDYRASVEVIKRQAGKMSELIGQLLSITRMDQGTQKLNVENACLSDLVEVIAAQTAAAQTKSVRLIREIEAEVFADFDVGLMSRLVQNLVDNAYKFTPEGGVVTVGLRRDEDELRLTVADSGVGIAKEDLDKIWRRFWQADGARGGDAGTGLGLSMVKQIAELHGASISVDSEPGRGSAFTLTMPAKKIT